MVQAGYRETVYLVDVVARCAALARTGRVPTVRALQRAHGVRCV